MSTILLDPRTLGVRLSSDARLLPKVIQRAMFSAGQRGKAFIVGKTPVDRGFLRNAWRVIKLSNGGVELINDQPYAGIMEVGARPFKVGYAGILALKGWVLRMFKAGRMQPRSVKITSQKRTNKLHQSALEKEAESIAYAIARKFEKVGMKGKRFVMLHLPELAELMDAEINRYLANFFNRPVQGAQ